MKQQLEAIREIDPKAAEYLETEILPRYSEEKLEYYKSKRFEICDLFFWSLSPQGRDYWLNIWRKLNGTKSGN
jgi:hypothetical protein